MRDDEESAQLTSHGTYLRNEEVLSEPHHVNSQLYAESRTSAQIALADDHARGKVACFWVLPEQHGHAEWVTNILLQDYAKVKNPREYLNDTIVDFQATHTYASWPAQFKERVLMINSFYFKKLLKNRPIDDPDNAKALLRWCRKYGGPAQMLRKEYMVVPKCARLHWELIIVCNAGCAQVTANRGEQSRSPAILILDSLNHTRRKTETFRIILDFVNLMRTNDHREVLPPSIKQYCVQVPQQPNLWDCGTFLLRSLQEFGRDGGFATLSSSKAMARRTWYPPTQGVAYRREIINNLDKLMRTQQPIIDQRRSEIEQPKPEAMKCDDEKSTEAATCDADIREADDEGEFDTRMKEHVAAQTAAREQEEVKSAAETEAAFEALEAKEEEGEKAERAKEMRGDESRKDTDETDTDAAKTQPESG